MTELHPLLQLALEAERVNENLFNLGRLDLETAQAKSCADILAISLAAGDDPEVRTQLVAAAVLQADRRRYCMVANASVQRFSEELDGWDGTPPEAA